MTDNQVNLSHFSQIFFKGPAESAEIAEIFYLLCKYLVYAATRGIFPQENISAISAISAGPKTSEPAG